MSETQAAPRKRLHRATYATDKRNGGYLIRVTGPTPNVFAGRTVPVTTKAQTEHLEELLRLVWSGADKETGEMVALYTFKSKPREPQAEVEF
jgi:chaperone required for assembly of F1-ATPase